MKASTCIKTGLATICLLLFSGIVLSQPTGTTSSGLNVAKKGIWPQKTCSVCWENPSPSNLAGRMIVRQAIADTWEKFSAFRFTGWDACRLGQKGIRILIDDQHPHVDGLGTELDGDKNGMVLNFNWSGCNISTVDCIAWVAIHEFGHALGIAHEQNRGDAPEACNEESQGSDGDWYLTPYDEFSVMNYCNPKWNNSGVLSPSDVAGIQKLYGANDFEDLGGQLSGEPVACSMKSGRLDVFVVGAEGAAYHKYYADGTWYDYENLGGDFKVGPVVFGAAFPLSTVSWGKNHLDVYGRGTDGAVYQKWWNEAKGQWEGWHNLGGSLMGAPVAVSWGPGRIDLFGIGMDGALWHNWWDANLNNQRWGGWESLGGKFKFGSVSAVSQAVNKLDIVGIGMDDQLYHKSWNQRWSDWQPLGGKFSEPPTIVSGADGYLDVFGIGMEKGLYHKRFANGGWSNGWSNLRGKCLSRPSAVSIGIGHCTVMIRGTDGGLYENRWNDESERFDGFKRVGGAMTDAPFAVRVGLNIHVLMRAPKNELLHVSWRDPYVNKDVKKLMDGMDADKIQIQRRF